MKRTIPLTPLSSIDDTSGSKLQKPFTTGLTRVRTPHDWACDNRVAVVKVATNSCRRVVKRGGPSFYICQAQSRCEGLFRSCFLSCGQNGPRGPFARCSSSALYASLVKAADPSWHLSGHRTRPSGRCLCSVPCRHSGVMLGTS